MLQTVPPPECYRLYRRLNATGCTTASVLQTVPPPECYRLCHHLNATLRTTVWKLQDVPPCECYRMYHHLNATGCTTTWMLQTVPPPKCYKLYHCLNAPHNLPSLKLLLQPVSLSWLRKLTTPSKNKHEGSTSFRNPCYAFRLHLGLRTSLLLFLFPCSGLLHCTQVI